MRFGKLTLLTFSISKSTSTWIAITTNGGRDGMLKIFLEVLPALLCVPDK